MQQVVWPVYEMWTALLRSIYAQRDTLWPADCPVSPGGSCRLPARRLTAEALEAAEAADAAETAETAAKAMVEDAVIKAHNQA